MTATRLPPGTHVVVGPPLHLRRGDRDLVLLEGGPPWLARLLLRLAAHPDGLSAGALVAALEGEASAAEVEAVLARLRSDGALQDATAPATRARGAVDVVGAGPFVSRLRDLLAAGGVAVLPGAADDAARRLAEGAAAALVLVHEESVAPSWLAAWNRAAFAARRAWLLVSVQGGWVRVGPLVVPGETSCGACYDARLATHRRNPEAHAAWRALDRPLRPAPDALHDAAAAGLVAGEVRRVLDSPGRSEATGRFLAGRVLVADLTALTFDLETVLEVPYCPVCDA